MLVGELDILRGALLALATEETLTHIQRKRLRGYSTRRAYLLRTLDVAPILGLGEQWEATELLREGHTIQIGNILPAVAAQYLCFSKKHNRYSLEVVTAVRQVKTLVVDREVRDALRANGNGKTEPVVEAWILNLVLHNLALAIGKGYVANLTSPPLHKAKGKGIALKRSGVVGGRDITLRLIVSQGALDVVGTLKYLVHTCCKARHNVAIVLEDWLVLNLGLVA